MKYQVYCFLITWVGFMSQLLTCDSVKVQFLKIAVIFIKMTSFLFNSFIQTFLETCDNWLNNCGFNDTSCVLSYRFQVTNGFR